MLLDDSFSPKLITEEFKGKDYNHSKCVQKNEITDTLKYERGADFYSFRYREGYSKTVLPDGRVIYIGGRTDIEKVSQLNNNKVGSSLLDESDLKKSLYFPYDHPDFMIYNDVTVVMSSSHDGHSHRNFKYNFNAW